MKNFLRGGRGLSIGELLNTLLINLISRYVLNSLRFNSVEPFGVLHYGRTVWPLLITIFCVLFNSTLAQSRDSLGAAKVDKPVYELPAEGSISPLYMGDSIPEAFWNYKMPIYLDTIGRDSVCLADFRDDNKVLIIDFWPTWCGPCVESVLRLDSITRTKEYKNIQFISMCVNETEEHLNAFIDRTQFAIPSLFDFSYLSNRIITRYLGYYGVIMIKDGKLWGAPDKRMLSDENLNLIEEGNWEELTVSFLPEKKKIYFAKEIVKEVLQ